MDDFIVISDDSGPESYGEATSSRARRLRRALSRGSGALPRRTVAWIMAESPASYSQDIVNSFIGSPSLIWK